MTATETDGCHRGIFRIPGPLPGYEWVPTITYEPVRDRIWTFSEGIYRTIAVEGDTGLLAFDTFYSPGSAGSYAYALGRLFARKRVHTLVYSHDHLDHTGFAADFAPDAEIVCHEEAAEVIAARRSDGQTAPTEVWSGERHALELDGIALELIYPGPTHGNGNVAAYFPESKVLFMVDTVIPGVGYTFLPDWHLTGYVETMRRLLALDWDIFVPGHFWRLDRRGFADNLAYYELLAGVAQDGLAAGIDADDYEQVKRYTYERLDREWGHLFRFDEYAALNLMRLLLHLRTGGWGLEDAR
jgi:glyoxylase-like metal-dependent hydrolase (beta-lactamase superfamily II)